MITLGGGYSGCPHVSHFRREGGNIVSLQWKAQDSGQFYFGFGIDGTGQDPKTYLTIDQTEITNKTEIKWSVYDTLAKAGRTPIVSEKARNLFLEFAESVAKTLGVSNCFVCGGTNMGEQWPWEAIEASAEVLSNLSSSGTVTKRSAQASDITWALTTNLV